MSLTQLIYASRASKPITDALLEDILKVARGKNTQLDITGVLFSDSRFFIQYIEGGVGDINTLYKSLVEDSRHQDVTLLHFSSVEKRLFEGWHMQHVKEHNICEMLDMGDAAGSAKECNPFTMLSHLVLQKIERYAEFMLRH